MCHIAIEGSCPHMRSMDDKAYVFEAHVGEGRLFACSLNLPGGANGEALSRYLIDCILVYLGGRLQGTADRISPQRLRAVCEGT